MSWSVRGIDDEARERALDAARRSGKPVGEWLNTLIRDGAAPPARATGAAVAQPPDGTGLERRLDDLGERIRRLTDTAAPPPRADGDHPAETEEGDLRMLAEAVGRLARDSTDRPARNPRGRREGAAAPRTGPGGNDNRVDSLLDTLDGLDERLRRMQGRADPARPAAPAAAPRVAAETSSPVDTEMLEKAVAEINQRRRELSAGPAADARAPVARLPEPYRVADLEAQIRALGERIEQSVSRESTAGDALLREIRGLRKAMEARDGAVLTESDLADIRGLGDRLDDLARRQPDRSVLDPIAAELGRLREAVQRSNPEAALRALADGYDGIGRRLDDLGRRMHDEGFADRVDGRLADIRQSIAELPSALQLARLGGSLELLAERVEEVAARPEPSLTVELEADLREIRAAVDRHDPERLTALFDQRLRTLTAKLDGLERLASGPIAPERMDQILDEMRSIAAGSRQVEELRGIERRMAEVANRLAVIESRPDPSALLRDLADRIEELTASVDRVGGPDAIVRGDIERLQAGLDALIAASARDSAGGRVRLDDLEAVLRLVERRLEQDSAKPHLDAMEAFEARISHLIDKLDRLEPRSPGRDVEALGAEIAAMRNELTRMAVPRTDPDVTARLDEIAHSLQRPVASGIEDGFALLARRLEATESRFSGLESIEDTLGRLHDRLADRDDRMADLAREAAREALADFARLTRDEGTAAALKVLQEDLRGMQRQDGNGAGAAGETFRSVQEALSSVVARLQSAEAASAADAPTLDLGGRRPDGGKADFVDALRVGTAASRARAAAHPAPPAAEAARPAARAAAAAAHAAAQKAQPARAPVRPAETRAAEPAADDARKVDFIAAARRAAQAARTAEPLQTLQPLRGQEPEDRFATEEPAVAEGPLARLGKVIKGRSRPLMVAAAAVFLAVFALQYMPAGTMDTTDAGTPDANLATADAAHSAEPRPADPKAADAGKSAPASVLAPPVTPPRTFAEAPRAPSSAGFGRDGADTPPAAKLVPLAPLVQPAPVAETETIDPVTTASTRPAALSGAGAASPLPQVPDAIGSAALRQAAASGDGRAQFELGLRFAEGRGVSPDLKAASAWYTLAAEKGVVPAQYRLGSAWEKGHTGTRDVAQARRWYSEAADKGNVRAMHNLGVLYANDRDMANAIAWFQKAADHGLRDSQFNLGIVNVLGSGVPQDLAAGYKWFALAAAQGDKDAEKKRDDVAAHLDKAALAAAKASVQAFRPKPLDRNANDEAIVWVEPGSAGASATAAPSTDDAVQRAQTLLQSRGVYAGPVNGELTSQTRHALRLFQRRQGLKPTGEPDTATLQALEGRTG
ncbi:peptidoglycan-binding protein [Prosthecomicrobium sp. N25]|uniref:peptidoglycan-binding protein n=1 Tax=Prosthecomicrobium sp. N25 TaxID=3129254 RepID=UPI0030769720